MDKKKVNIIFNYMLEGGHIFENDYCYKFYHFYPTGIKKWRKGLIIIKDNRRFSVTVAKYIKMCDNIANGYYNSIVNDYKNILGTFKNERYKALRKSFLFLLFKGKFYGIDYYNSMNEMFDKYYNISKSELSKLMTEISRKEKYERLRN